MGNNHSTPADDGQEAPRRRQRPPRRPSHASGSSVGQISTAGSAQPGAPASSQPPATSSRTDRTTRWASGLETPTMYRRETRAERDARRRARDEAARLQERERSMREESVDGGFLVTLGTYQGVEDFAKPVVRRLQIERRLAPFWRPLDDHSSDWTEDQLVAAAQGLPRSPAGAPSPGDAAPSGPDRNTDAPSSGANMPPMASPSVSSTQDRPTGQLLSAVSQPALSSPSVSSPHASSPAEPAGSSASASSHAIGSRPRAPRSLVSAFRSHHRRPTTPQEVQLPADPFVNGKRVEVALYRKAYECPICFLYYPPHLNKTSCCSQFICSECFVQIKRRPPHYEEHPDPKSPPPEATLISEPAACPYCKQPSFGIAYEPPMFRRGLVYTNPNLHPMSSTSSLVLEGRTAGAGRAASLLGPAEPVPIHTDDVRPHWRSELEAAIAVEQRRASHAAAVHQTYVIPQEPRAFRFGRRSRTSGLQPVVLSSSPPRQDSSTAQGIEPAEEQPAEATSGMLPNRHSSRAFDVDEINNAMLAEAIRLSLVEDEGRKKDDKQSSKELRKEEKDAAKENKNREKQKAKRAKTEEKATRRNSFLPWRESNAAPAGGDEGTALLTETRHEPSSTSTRPSFPRPRPFSIAGRPGPQASGEPATVPPSLRPSSATSLRQRLQPWPQSSHASSSQSSFSGFHPSPGRVAADPFGASASSLPSPDFRNRTEQSRDDATPAGDSASNFRSLDAVIGSEGSNEAAGSSSQAPPANEPQAVGAAQQREDESTSEGLAIGGQSTARLEETDARLDETALTEYTATMEDASGHGPQAARSGPGLETKHPEDVKVSSPAGQQTTH